ncbi:DUF4326 domain-containing protein [Novosphingobium sp. FKTRR1]|uniref:DUF4326 domain-containing protein n=1 Tax=Novosphingobium sp. FKTRR1 TaxID=2879118 RepID=UPI00351DA165
MVMKRIQRSRRKGWQSPPGVIYVGRPTMWGNPFQAMRWGHAKSVIVHDQWLQGRVGAMTLEGMGFCPAEIEAIERLRIRVLTNLHRLADHDLACWCPCTSAWCHAETLLRLAPAYAEYEQCAA